MPDARPLDGIELHDLGIVQEVNRRLLHPIGLALAYEPDGTCIVIADPDPDGWHYVDVDLGPGAAAFARRQAEWHPRRLAALGWIIQPLPGPDECPVEGCGLPLPSHYHTTDSEHADTIVWLGDKPEPAE